MIEQVDGSDASRIFLKEAGIQRSRGVTFLRQLAKNFSQLPYENLSKLIKIGQLSDPSRALRLPEEVVTDHFERNFGGTCFSLTFLFDRILRFAGFACYKVMAEMRSGRNVHCLVIVEERGSKYLIDPGYALYEVIELPKQGKTSVACPHAVVEIVADGEGRYDLWTVDPSGRKWRYRFEDVPVDEGDFERYWIESFARPTLSNVCLTRLTPQGHIYFRKDFFKFTSLETVTKRRVKEGIERVVAAEFGIDGQWVNQALEVLNRRRSR